MKKLRKWVHENGLSLALLIAIVLNAVLGYSAQQRLTTENKDLRNRLAAALLNTDQALDLTQRCINGNTTNTRNAQAR